MAETDSEAGGDAPPKKMRSKLMLFAGSLALLAGGGGFLTVQAGFLDPILAMIGVERSATHSHDSASTPRREGGTASDAAYVFIDPIVISLGPQSRSKHLKVGLAIDVAPGREPDVTATLPRVVDTLQGFLRAVDERELDAPLSMDRLRAQMLRRVQLVTPAGAVRDLLIQEFVLN